MTKTGVKAYMDAVAKRGDDIDEMFKQVWAGSVGQHVVDDGVNIWRALKTLTEGEAKKVVLSVKDEDGFKAWQRLHQRFEPGLSARQGLVLSELGAMVRSPSKSPTEMRTMITELEQRIKQVEDITGRQIDEVHAKSILIGIMDPITRQNTARDQGGDFQSLKKLVLEFVNNAVGLSDAMQIGQFGGDQRQPPEKQTDEA